MKFLPDFVETDIKQIDYFVFLLPATAFNIDDGSMIVEISVDYRLAPTGETYQANVWARQKGAKVKHFIYPVSAPVSQNPEMSIVSALNEDEIFLQLMRDFLCEAAKHRCD